MPTLIVMRHGKTLWGEENRFAGWADTPLSEAGFAEARAGARTLRRTGLTFGLCLTSHLLRARQTTDVVAEILKLPATAVVADWRLNERHYGALQGCLRAEMVAQFGNAEVVAWRRSYAARPPALEDGDPRWQEQLARLSAIPASLQPRTESLADAAERVAPVWFEAIAPRLKAGDNVLVIAHTSAIRGLARVIEGLSDDHSAAFRISTAIPRRYRFDAGLGLEEVRDLPRGLQQTLRHWVTRLKPRGLGRM